MNFLTLDSPFARYAEQLARVADPFLIERMEAAGLNRAFRRRLQSKARKGDLHRTDFPAWLVARFMSAGDGALA
jgi:hypothetical protein